MISQRLNRTERTAGTYARARAPAPVQGRPHARATANHEHRRAAARACKAQALPHRLAVRRHSVNRRGENCRDRARKVTSPRAPSFFATN